MWDGSRAKKTCTKLSWLDCFLFLIFQMHLKTDCQFEELSCPRADCKEKILRKDLPDHVEKTCKYRETTCKYCKSQVPMIMLQVQYFLVYIEQDSIL